MDEMLPRIQVSILEVTMPLTGIGAGLLKECFTQGMVAADQIFVSGFEPLQQP